MANHLRSELVLDALEMAVTQRKPRDVIHHSDQGSQPGFKRSSQHQHGRIVRSRREPRRGFSIPVSCAVCR